MKIIFAVVLAFTLSLAAANCYVLLTDPWDIAQAGDSGHPGQSERRLQRIPKAREVDMRQLDSSPGRSATRRLQVLAGPRSATRRL